MVLCLPLIAQNDAEKAWPDSTVSYINGNKQSKTVFGFDEDGNRTKSIYVWEAGKWVFEDTIGVTGKKPVIRYEIIDGEKDSDGNSRYGYRLFIPSGNREETYLARRISVPSNTSGTVSKQERYDSQGNLILFGCEVKVDNTSQFNDIYTISYDEGNNPTLIEARNEQTTTIHEFQYDSKGNMTVYQFINDYNSYYETVHHYYSAGTGIEPVSEVSAPSAYAHGGTLYLQSPRAGQVAIYAISGAKLYEGAIPAGTTTIAARLPKGVCIVAFGDGTRRKVWVNE
jgi:hypothetical protein